MWIDEPSHADAADFIPLLRPKPGKKVVALLVDRPLRLFLHYWSKKTWPCVGPNCPLCARQISKRLYAYYPACSIKGNPAVIELTPVAENSLNRQMLEHSDEPTGMIEVFRPTGRKNLPCEVRWRPLEPTDPQPTTSKRREFLVETLCRMWKLPCPRGDSTSSDWIDELRASLIAAVEELESNK